MKLITKIKSNIEPTRLKRTCNVSSITCFNLGSSVKILSSLPFKNKLIFKTKN